MICLTVPHHRTTHRLAAGCWRSITFLLLSLLTAGWSAASEAPPLEIHRLPLAVTNSFDRRQSHAPASPAVIAASLCGQLVNQTSVAAFSGFQSAKLLSAGRTRDFSAVRRVGTGTPLQLFESTSTRAVIEAVPTLDGSDIDRAREFLRQHAGALHLSDPDRELVVEREELDAIGRRHVRFSQQHHGMPVWPAELTVHLDRSGHVEMVDGSFVATPRRLAPEPMLTAGDATRAATRAVSGSVAIGEPELIVHAPHDRYPRLAWRVDVSSSLLSRWWIIVDASNGVILDRISRVMNDAATGSGVDLLGVTRSLKLWQSSGSYYLIDTTKPMYDSTSRPPDLDKVRGAIVTLDAQNKPPTANPDSLPDLYFPISSNPNSWSIPATVSAAFWLGATYDYYLKQFNRNSIDGKGGTIKGVTRVGTGMLNAFWLDGPALMIFGDGDRFPAGVDVIGHEMTHGVTANTAALIYKDQPGALNEAMSDIFGEMIEADATGSNDWLLGTQLTDSRLKRSMIDPGRFNQPSKMSDFVQTSSDHGGVHINSGIINRAFYLLAEGMTGAIGRKDASSIFYRALTQHLVKESQFIDARLACIQSANELFGAGSRQASMTAQAFDAVEIFDASPPREEPRIPPVAGSDATLFVYFDTRTNADFLGRRETSGDGASGIPLSRFSIAEERPSVSGDGSLAVFVDSIHDVCLIPTDNSAAETCLGLPAQGIRVSSVGMSRDASRFGFVLLHADGTPDNRIIVVDLKTKATASYTLTSSAQDGGNIASILFADTMAFTADGQFIVFDAFNAITLSGGSRVGAWSIAALDLNSGTSFDVVSPEAGFDIEFPDIGRTTDDLLAFELRDSASGDVAVIAANLGTGKAQLVGLTKGVLPVPSYTGDDTAIVYGAASNTPTKTSLYKQPVAPDGITPTGSPSLWLDDAGFATIYRRGSFAGPTTTPGQISFSSQVYKASAGATATITLNRFGGNQGTVSVSYRTQDGTAVAGRDYTASSGTLTWGDRDDNPKTFHVSISPQAGSGSLTLVLANATGGAQISSDRATLTIAPSFTTSQPGRRRSARH